MSPEEVDATVEHLLSLPPEKRDKEIWADWNTFAAQQNQSGACNPEVWRALQAAEEAERAKHVQNVAPTAGVVILRVIAA